MVIEKSRKSTMNSLTEQSLYIIFKSLLENNERVRNTVGKFILNRDLTNLQICEHCNDIGKELFNNLRQYSDQLGISKNDLSYHIAELLNEKHWIALTRVLQSMNKLPVYYPIDETRISVYLKELKFQSNIIDFEETSAAICERLDFKRIQLLALLKEEERHLIEILNPRQIDVLKNFTPQGINVISKLTKLPYEQQLMILLMTTEEINLFHVLNYEGIRILLNLDQMERNLLLNDNPLYRKMMKQQILEQSGAYPDRMAKLNLINSLDKLTPNTINSYRNLIKLKLDEYEKFNEQIVYLITELDTLKVDERDKLFKLKDNEKQIFKDLNEEEIGIFLKFPSLRSTLQMIYQLNSQDRDILLTLQTNEMMMISSQRDGEEILRIANFSDEGRSRLIKLQNLNSDERNEILRLSSRQRKILAKLYYLRHDGLKIVSELGPNKTYKILQLLRENSSDLENLDLKELVLFKRINNLQSGEKNEIIHLTLDELFVFDVLSSLKIKITSVLMDLSLEGITVLEKISHLNQDEMNIVLKLGGTEGIITLVQNNRLDSEEINALDKLKENEAKFIFNLSLEQRYHLKNNTWQTSKSFTPNEISMIDSLSVEGVKILGRIILLDEKERARLRDVDPNELALIDHLNSDEINLIASLNNEKIKRLANILNWRIEEELTFELFTSLIDHSNIIETKQILLKVQDKMLLPVSRICYLKLIASIVVARTIDRSNSAENLEFVEKISNVVGEIYPATSALDFNVYVLNYSIRDRFQRNYLSELFRKIVANHQGVGSLEKFCNSNDPEGLLLFRWILTDPIAEQMSYDFIRSILLSENFGNLNGILSCNDDIPRKSIVEALKKQFIDRHYELSITLFFAQSDSSMTVWLPDILNENNCFEFLNSPIGNVGDEMNVLEYAIRFNRNDPLPFLEKIHPDQLGVLFEKNSVKLFRYLARYGRTDVLEVLIKRMERERLVFIIQSNYKEIFHSFDEVFENPTHRFSELAKTIKWFVDIFPDLEFYHGIVREFVNHVRSFSSVEEFDNVIDRLVNEHIDRHDLLNMIEEREENSASCRKRRIKRDLSNFCIDSNDVEDITDEKEELRMRSLFDNIQTENFDIYDLMSLISEQRNTEKDLKTFSERISNVRLDSVDPEIRDILSDAKDNVDSNEKVTEILRKSNAAVKIQKVAEKTGLAFTLFLVGKHVINGDIKSLGYDSMNLYVLPKLGEVVSKNLMAKGERIGSRMTKGFAPILGRCIGNFAAFLGLEESIRARKNAGNNLDMEIADLNIITNTVFIVADIPALVTGIMSSSEMAIGTIGEYTGPIGWALSIGVIVVSELIQSALRINDLSKHIQLTTDEKISIYWKFLLDRELPDYIVRDIEIKRIYNDYVSKIINKFQQDYEMIGISLPDIVVTKQEYAKPFNFILNLYYQVLCSIETRIIDTEMDFSSNSVTMNPFSTYDINQISRLLPTNVQSFHLVCGPKENDIRSYTKMINRLIPLPLVTCQSEKTGESLNITRITERWYIPQRENGDCDNILLYRNETLKDLQKILFYLSQDSTIKIPNTNSMDVIFSGQSLSIVDYVTNGSLPDPPSSRYYFTKEIDYCKLYKEGLNFIYVKHNGSFACDLGGESTRQSNVAVVQGTFSDIRNIHSITGSEKSDRITVSHAKYVDGKGGRDVIYVKNFTTVKSYYGDVVHGNTTILLPMNVSEIHKIVINHRITVYHKNNSSIQTDVDSSLQTIDEFFIVPMKINNETHLVTDLYVHKNFNADVDLKNQLDVLKEIKCTRYNCIKQITSRNYDITLSDNHHSIFYPDKNNHNFYWEASDEKNHLYVFDAINANVTISRARGVLDFGKFNLSGKGLREELKIVHQPTGSLQVTLGDLWIDLLENRQPFVKITFNGREYFQIHNGKLERDYCSHSFRVKGKLFVDSRELLNRHNCFEFQSDKVIFLKYRRDLLLLSESNMLTVTNYFPFSHGSLDLSLKMNSTIVKPEEFREKANRSNPFKFYEMVERGFIIYHNQPIDKSQIGVIDMKNSSILDHDINIRGDDLLLTNENVSSVTLVNWSNLQAAREIMFAFNDTLIINAQCVLSYCTPKYIFNEFQRQKMRVKSRRKRNVQLDHSANYVSGIIENKILPEITGNNDFRFFHSFNHNVNLALLFLESFIDQTYPLPRFRSITPEEIFTHAMNITENFQDRMNEISKINGIDLKKLDYFQLYTDIVQHLRNEEFSKISNTLVLAMNKVLNFKLRINIPQS